MTAVQITSVCIPLLICLKDVTVIRVTESFYKYLYTLKAEVQRKKGTWYKIFLLQSIKVLPNNQIVATYKDNYC